jgi:hypothetical protein
MQVAMFTPVGPLLLKVLADGARDQESWLSVPMYPNRVETHRSHRKHVVTKKEHGIKKLLPKSQTQSA